MLSNISKVQLYEYQLLSNDHVKVGHLGGSQDTRREIGVLAQELTSVIPDAVQETVSGEGERGRGGWRE